MSAGFLAMPGIIPFPPLGSTAGLGGFGFEVILPPEVDGFIALFATAPAPAARVQLSSPVPTKRAPSVKVTITRAPKKKG